MQLRRVDLDLGRRTYLGASDGTTGYGGSIAHEYSLSGDYTVTLQVARIGLTDVATGLARIDLPPTPSFTVTCDERTVPSTPRPRPTTWDLRLVLGLRRRQHRHREQITHGYAVSGAFTVTLDVTDTGGQTSSTSQTIVIDLPPVAAFDVRCQGTTCAFDASASTDDVAIDSYTWQFGDGETGNGVQVDHAFPAGGGLFTVELIVGDSRGQSSTFAVEIDVVDDDLLLILLTTTTETGRTTMRNHVSSGEENAVKRIRRQIAGAVALASIILVGAAPGLLAQSTGAGSLVEKDENLGRGFDATRSTTSTASIPSNLQRQPEHLDLDRSELPDRRQSELRHGPELQLLAVGVQELPAGERARPDQRRGPFGPPRDGVGSYTQAWPSWLFNAGLGWEVSLGRVYEPLRAFRHRPGRASDRRGAGQRRSALGLPEPRRGAPRAVRRPPRHQRHGRRQALDSRDGSYLRLSCWTVRPISRRAGAWFWSWRTDRDSSSTSPEIPTTPTCRTATAGAPS